MINPAVRNSIRGAGRQAYPHQVARALPRAGLLLYLGRPNLEAADVPLGDDTEIGDDTIIRWKFLLPADADIRAATGWVSGAGNIFYDAAGDPVAVFASDIADWADINRYNVLFHLVSEDTETGRLAIYALDADHATLNKARRVLREDQYGYWAPLGSILHYDAEVAPLTELVGGVHTLNHSVLEPQYQRLADGSYINVGAQPAVDVLEGGIKGLRTCGAITNLLPGDTSIARTVTLTAQVYTLQVVGAGSASCSYGSATVGSPLTFTAAAGTTTFTPSGATLWILTATPYPTPYVPPGVTQPASNATTTNGVWFALPDGSPLWQALDGEPDGVELRPPLDPTVWDDYPLGLPTSIVSSGAGLLLTTSGAGGYRPPLSVPSVVGARYKLVCRIRNINTTSVSIRVNSGVDDIYLGPAVTSTSFQLVETVVTATTTSFLVYLRNAAAGQAELESLSIQRIQPQPFTLATRIPMGVGSADLPDNTFLGQASCLTAYNQTLYTYRSSGGGFRAIASSDGPTIIVSGIDIVIPRNAIVRNFLQVNTAGNRFRVGYMIERTHTTIQWSHPSEDSTTWAVFDGSFDPSTLYRFMLGYSNPYPIWFNKITGWARQVPTTELEAWA